MKVEQTSGQTAGSTEGRTERIFRIIQNTLVATPWARTMFREASALQGEFFKYVLRPDVGRSDADARYAGLLDQLAAMARVRIREGEEYLSQLQGRRGVIVASSHLGLDGAAYIDNRDGTFEYPREKVGGFPIAMLSGFLLSRLLTGNTQTDIRGEDRGDLAIIRRKLSGIVIPTTGQGRTEGVISQMTATLEAGEVHTFLTFPEGRTSGWANNGGPYDLDSFRSGAFVMGCRTGLPILPVGQYFDPNRGLDLHVQEPLHLNETDLPNLAVIQENTRQSMQRALDAVTP